MKKKKHSGGDDIELSLMKLGIKYVRKSMKRLSVSEGKDKSEKHKSKDKMGQSINDTT